MKLHRIWILLVGVLVLGGAMWILVWGSGTERWMETGVDAPEDSVGRSAAGEVLPAGKEVERAPGEGESSSGGGTGRVSDLGPGFGIEGKVVDVLGKGMPGVEVSVCAVNVLIVDGPGDAKLVTVESDKDGGFRIEKVWGERQFLFAETQQGDFGTLFLNKSPQGGWIRDVTVVVYEGQVARGRVLDQEGKVVEGAWILPVPILDTRYRYWQMREQRSDAEGRFAVGGLPPCGFKLSVWAPGYRLGLTKIEKESMSEPVEIRLERSTAIELPCRIEAEPEILARVLEESPRVQIRGIQHEGQRWALPSPFMGLRFAADGTCKFQGLRSGKINARFQASGALVRSVFLHRELEEGKVPQEMVWKPALRLPLEARLVDEIDRPLEGILLSTYRDSGNRVVRSDKDGRIRIPEFSPAGFLNYLQLETPGWYFETRKGFKTMKAVLPGVDQVFKLFRGPSVAGQVLRPDGEPAAGAEVVLIPDEPQTGDVLGVAESDAEGRFRITPHWPKEPRQVRLTATLEKTLVIHPESLQLKRASRIEGVVLRLQAGARIEGRLVHEDRRPAIGHSMHLDSVQVDWLQRWSWSGGLTMSDAEGRFVFEGVPAGTWKLLSRKGEGYLDKEPIRIDVVLGVTKDLGTIVVRKGASIAGRFLDLEGKPHAMWITLHAYGGLQLDPRIRHSRSADLKPDGSFRVTGLLPGDYQLEFQWRSRDNIKPDLATISRLSSLDSYRTHAKAGQTDLEFRVPKAGFGDLEIRFLATGSDWMPSQVHLRLDRLEQLWGGGEKHMDVEKGLVSVRGIQTGRYRLSLGHPRFGRLNQELLIQAGETCKTEVDLRQLTGRIEVLVRDEHGQAVVGAQVGLLPLPDKPAKVDDPWGIYWPPSKRIQARLLSDAKGQAALLAAPGRECLVMVWKPGSVPFARRVRAGATRIEATLRQGTRVRFALSKKTLGPGEERWPWGATLRLLHSEAKDRDPRLNAGTRVVKGVSFLLYGKRPHSLDCLPPGRYRVTVGRPPGPPGSPEARPLPIVREFVLQVGKPLDVDL